MRSDLEVLIHFLSGRGSKQFVHVTPALRSVTATFCGPSCSSQGRLVEDWQNLPDLELSNWSHC